MQFLAKITFSSEKCGFREKVRKSRKCVFTRIPPPRTYEIHNVFVCFAEGGPEKCKKVRNSRFYVEFCVFTGKCSFEQKKLISALSAPLRAMAAKHTYSLHIPMIFGCQITRNRGFRENVTFFMRIIIFFGKVLFHLKVLIFMKFALFAKGWTLWRPPRVTSGLTHGEHGFPAGPRAQGPPEHGAPPAGAGHVHPVRSDGLRPPSLQ